ncbi:hypothetical protein TSOC_011741 [Tetrabaena socialis]|uniref:Kazal-like domain-containing protein n=1 Tax=Tetrabaena socialis TaxID=47790 RepID=A0A2J7ZJI1_9CHLO|nr:hypothetical protein TSOC_013756 [Tetrabaena socialis]PNH02290.1 hypothetical protein TSOC_011741 [Tetrabaena socialis]|eukprot:PNH00422.1 hypothetical protein TSOC_013756 [Tetrabaena socialis]
MRYRAGASPAGRAFAVATLMLMAASGSHACFDGCRATEYKPVCSDGKMWYNPCYLFCELGPNFTAFAECPSPPPAPVMSLPPSPPSPSLCDGWQYPYKTLTYYSSADCRTYTLFDVGADCMPDWKTATDYCTKLGLDLAPWDDERSNDALQVLVAGRRFTSWVGGKTPAGLCGVMTQEGRVTFQGCYQPVRFICRSKSSACPPAPPLPPPTSPLPPSPPAPSPSPPNPECNPATTKNTTLYNPTDCKEYTLYDIDAECLVDWFMAKEVCEQAGMELAPHTYGDVLLKLCRDRGFTCWTGGRDSDLCPLMTAGGNIIKQGCNQPMRWVCRTKGCIAKCDLKYPGWAVSVCDEDGARYQNWCYAACSGLYLYTLCAPPAGTVTGGDNILTLKENGCEYRLFTVDAEMLLTYSKADESCTALGAGWGLVPHSDDNGWDAVRQLSAKNKFTSWVKKESDDAQCPLMDAMGLLQEQGCEDQSMRFVCRTCT